jgi:hypothetical protein
MVDDYDPPEIDLSRILDEQSRRVATRHRL